MGSFKKRYGTNQLGLLIMLPFLLALVVYMISREVSGQPIRYQPSAGKSG